jgi:hypothetical protein
MKDDAKLAKQPYNNFNRFQNDGSGKQLTPPSWVVKCLAPWIDPWCNNGRVMRETHSKNTSQKDFILDEDGITSNAIFEKFKKKVVTSVTPQQAKRVACVLIAKTQERDVDILQNVIRQLTATNMPFAILARTCMTYSLKKDISLDHLSFVHILRPFAQQEDLVVEIRASWICGGLSIPDGEIMAAEDIFFKERLSERNSKFSATARGIKKINTIEAVQKLAQKVLELRIQSEEVMVARVEAQKFDMPAIDLNKMKFQDLIDFATKSSLINPKMAVLALKDAVTRAEMINKLEGAKLIDICKAILLMDSPSVQREAAIILATYDIGRESDEWQSILGVAITALEKLKDKDVSTSLSKSLNFLISKGVHAYPDNAAAAALHFCKQPSFTGEFPLQMAKQLEAWARKYTARGPAVKWHEILKVLGAPGMPKINQVDEGTATVNFGLKERRGDPISVMEYNANGLTARWKDHSASNTNAKQEDGQLHPSKHAKKQLKVKIFKKGDLRKVIQQTGSPDVVAIIYYLGSEN